MNDLRGGNIWKANTNRRSNGKRPKARPAVHGRSPPNELATPVPASSHKMARAPVAQGGSRLQFWHRLNESDVCSVQLLAPRRSLLFREGLRDVQRHAGRPTHDFTLQSYLRKC